MLVKTSHNLLKSFLEQRELTTNDLNPSRFSWKITREAASSALAIPTLLTSPIIEIVSATHQKDGVAGAAVYSRLSAGGNERRIVTGAGALKILGHNYISVHQIIK